MKKACFMMVMVSVLMSCAFVSKAHAVVVDYTFHLGGTLNGNDVTDIFILETDGTQVSVDYAFTAASRGKTTLTHVIPFSPSLALVIGLDRAVPGVGDEKDHIVMFMNNDFAVTTFGKKFSQVFPAVDGGERVRHSTLIAALEDAQNGDLDALDLITDFFMTGAGQYAAFNPAGSFRVIEFTNGTSIDIPEPTTMALLGLGLIGAALRRRRRK